MEDRALHQVKAFQDAINTRFRDEVPLLVHKMPRQLSGRFVRKAQCQIDNLLPGMIRDPVQELTRI